MKDLVNNISKGKNLEVNLPKFGQEMMDVYYKYAAVRLAINHYTYNEMMNSFDIQSAAQIDTLKFICKTSLKMHHAIDSDDVEAYQKYSKVYDAQMKAGKFTAA